MKASAFCARFMVSAASTLIVRPGCRCKAVIFAVHIDLQPMQAWIAILDRDEVLGFGNKLEALSVLMTRIDF